METYLDVILDADGEKASIIHKKIIELGFKPMLGQHDYIYKWEGLVNLQEEMELIENVQRHLKGTGALLKFTTVR